MANWDSVQYLRFATERSRPARDLMARVPLETPKVVYDLGCGAGNITRLLAERWPAAEITGVDSSPEMLAKARTSGNGAIRWEEADLRTWKPARPADLFYSNAALQWLDDHASVFPRLAGLLAPGSVLAVQMPRNHCEPSHTLITETIEDGPWAGRLRSLIRPPVAAPEAYYDWLSPVVLRLEIWETIYWQILDGDNPVVEFTKGTALRPFLEALEDDERRAFLDAYAKRVLAAYPPRLDGRTLFPFRRLFIVATC
jgi:trans-aconitate 2-methyltransferase